MVLHQVNLMILTAPEMVTELEFVGRDGWPVTVSWFLDANEEKDEAIFAISSDDRLVELVDACRMRVGSACGCGDTRVSSQWVIKTVRQLPTGSFEFLSALPAAIQTVKQNRIRFGRSFKRWLHSIGGVGLWLADHTFDSNEYMVEALLTGVEKYVEEYRA